MSVMERVSGHSVPSSMELVEKMSLVYPENFEVGDSL
jgi:hypothetical protein